jgi:hypothetical protein
MERLGEGLPASPSPGEILLQWYLVVALGS